MRRIQDTVVEGPNFEVKIKIPEKKECNKKPIDLVPPQIDLWLKENGLNQYGDPIDTVYKGGTPLFDEYTGKSYPRLSYILSRHPELRHLQNKSEDVSELRNLIQNLIDLINKSE